MNKLSSLTTFLLPVVAVFTLPAAPQVNRPGDLSAAEVAAVRQARRQSGRVILELRLDRREYLAQEPARVTVAVSNPTSDSLLIYDPFDARATCLEVSAWNGALDPRWPWFSTSAEPNCGGTYDPKAPTITLGPGQRIERSLPSPESSLTSPPPPISGGRYRMSFCYGNASETCAYAEFTVVEPVFRGSAVVKLAAPLRVKNPRTGQETTYPRYLHSYLLEAGGKRFVVIARLAIIDPRVYVDVGQALTRGNASSLMPFDRLAEVDAGADSLEITADQYDYATVRWRDGNRQPRAIWVSPDRTKVMEVR